MMQENQRPWERMIRDLHHGFSLLDREIELLRDIDQTILDYSRNVTPRSLENLFLESISRFSHIHHTDAPLLCYVYLGRELALLHNEEGSRPLYPMRIGISTAFDPLLKPAVDGRVIQPVFVSEESDQLFTLFPGARTILLCPMYSSSLLSVFLLADNHSPEGSYLKDPDFGRSVVTLIQQLAIAYTHYDHALQHQRIRELWDTFLKFELSPTKCFEQLARWVPSFLPTFGPLRFPGLPPEIQVLTLVQDAGQQQHLVIRGTTGREHAGTRIAIDGSICGSLVENEKLPYFCDDPTKTDYIARYKNYLGHEKKIRTELVVRLMRDEQLVGVLNLESEIENAFNKHHIDAILALSKIVAPIVTVLERRLGMNTLMQASVTSSTARYLEGLASVFGHASRTPLLDLKANIQFASGLIGEDIKMGIQRADTSASAGKKDKLNSVLREVSDKLTQTEAALARLDAIQSQISTYTKDFVNDINSYAKSGPMNLRDILEATVKLAKAAIITKLGKNIRIEFPKNEAAPEPGVFCSTLLKQHVYSILHNAILSIQDRLESDPSPGIISIEIFEYSPPNSQEVKLNKSWAVRIRDNGCGATSEQLENLKRFQPGIRYRGSSGEGHGLTAVQRYMASIDGRIDLDASPGKHFEVVLHFPEYRPESHETLTADRTQDRT